MRALRCKNLSQLAKVLPAGSLCPPGLAMTSDGGILGGAAWPLRQDHCHRKPLWVMCETGCPLGVLTQNQSEKLRSGIEVPSEEGPVSCTKYVHNKSQQIHFTVIFSTVLCVNSLTTVMLPLLCKDSPQIIMQFLKTEQQKKKRKTYCFSGCTTAIFLFFCAVKQAKKKRKRKSTWLASWAKVFLKWLM